MNSISHNHTGNKPQHGIVEVLRFCQAEHLPARVVGKWVWVAFDSKPSAEVFILPAEGTGMISWMVC